MENLQKAEVALEKGSILWRIYKKARVEVET